MSDEETLRRLAREAIRTQRIPAARPKGTWGGDGTGAPCDVCGLPVPKDEIEFEVEFSLEGARTRSCHLHSRCLAAWEFERHMIAAGEQPKGSNGGTPLQGLSREARPQARDVQHLSARSKAGSMPDRERDTKGKGESE